MSTAATEDYVAKRAELLANLVLTREKGVEVLSLQDTKEAGLHLIAQLPAIRGAQTALPILPRIGVEVMGTDESLETEEDANAYVRKHWKDGQSKGVFLGPIVLLLFSMDGDKGYFGWIMEPRVSKSDGPTLTRVLSPTMSKITKSSTDAIFREAGVWFDAMTRLLVRERK